MHIMEHEGPLDKSSPSYQRSKYNVMIEWCNGEITTDPLSIIAADDPVSCAIYARDNKLLNTDGWQCFKHIAKCEKLLEHLVNQAKLQSYKHSTKYKYGFQVPRNYANAIELDLKFGNNRWCDATCTECPNWMNIIHSRTKDIRITSQIFQKN